MESPAFEAAELETVTLQDRIDEAWRRGGGIVEVKAGVHRIGSIRLRSYVTLLLRSGAVLQASRNLADYDGCIKGKTIGNARFTRTRRSCYCTGFPSLETLPFSQRKEFRRA